MENNLVEVAIKAAVSAGTLLMEYYNEKVQTSSKESSRDIVSKIDQLAEQRIVEILKAYDSSITIITEEQGEIPGNDKDKFWLIDPIDGTVNYIHHIPFFCVSIAYIENNRVEAGAIYSPMFDDIYYGSRTIGAFKNHQKIAVENVSLGESLFAVSFSGKNYQPKNRASEFSALSKVNDISRGCLRTGSAALNLAYLAEGKLNGCWGKANKYWDIGAGLLIAELAGAVVEINKLDQENRLCSYYACSPSVQENFYKEIKEVIEV